MNDVADIYLLWPRQLVTNGPRSQEVGIGEHPMTFKLSAGTTMTVNDWLRD
jgi:hypothetical protein